MRIAIIGAGGVGGYFGARLAAAGEDVTFIARGAHLEAMQKDGLRVTSPLGDLTIKPVKAENDPQRVGSVDLVVIAVKLWSTDEALRIGERLLGPATGVVSFQNGVEAMDLAASRLGAARVMGGTAHIAALIEAPGVIHHNGRMASLTFGEPDGSPSERATALLEACRKAGIDARISDDIRRSIWEKFVFLVGVSGMACLTRTPIGGVRGDPVTREMLDDVMAEVAAVARAKGVELPTDFVDRQMAVIDSLPPDTVPSMLADLRRGNRLEVEWLAGAVVRFGREFGVPTPLNRAIYAALKLHSGGAVGERALGRG